MDKSIIAIANFRVVATDLGLAKLMNENDLRQSKMSNPLLTNSEAMISIKSCMAKRDLNVQACICGN